MICRECGARIDDDALECKFCGAVYGEAEPIQENTEPEAEETLNADTEQEEIDAIIDENEIKRRAQMEKLSAEKQAQLAEIEKRRKDKKRRQRRNRLLIILLILLFGAAIAAAVYYISPSYSGDYNDNVVLVTQEPTEKPKKTETSSTPAPTIEVVEPDETLEVVGNDETPAPIETQEEIAPTPQVTVKPAPIRTAVPTVKPAIATKKPVAKKGISGALVVGGDVIKANGKTYMSFNNNGKWAYATVSDNTTTSFINGKPMTITATPTNEKYDGVDVYSIVNITHYNGNYILQNSGTAIVTMADIQGMSKEQLRLARNEIYARHGRQFKDSELQSYFNSCSWYKPDAKYSYANENKNLNAVEKANIKTIFDYENSIQ